MEEKFSELIERREAVLLLHILSEFQMPRSPSICHCGEPVHTASVPQQTRSAPIFLIMVPISAAVTLGSAIIVMAKKADQRRRKHS